MASWPESVIWWHVYPLGFLGAEEEVPSAPPELHRLSRLHRWLDHLIALGCNGLALGPIFHSETHGYDTVDYFHIDPRLGSEDDFDALVAACHARGIRVLLDGVFNHAGVTFPPVREALSGGSDSPAGRWIRWSEGHPYFFEGHDRLVTLNHGSPEVQELVVEVMRHWLGRGADGWRLDAAYAVAPEFWASVLPPVRAEFPEAWFVGEVIHGDYADYVARAGFDSVTQYELWKAVWSSLADRNLWELDWTLRRHREMVDAFLPMTFLSNHDVSRVASKIGDPRHLSHAVALLLFLPGVPSIYYGDEYGLKAVKEDRPGGDDAVRPEMPADPLDMREGSSTTWRLYHRMISLRRRHPWLTRARLDTSEADHEHILLRASGDDGEALTLVLNLSDEPFRPPHAAAVVEASEPVQGDEIPAHGWVILEG